MDEKDIELVMETSKNYIHKDKLLSVEEIAGKIDFAKFKWNEAGIALSMQGCLTKEMLIHTKETFNGGRENFIAKAIHQAQQNKLKGE
jgi:predicted transcriptional regulator